MSQIPPSPKALELARQVLHIEADAVRLLADRIDGDFLRALRLILNCHGRVIVSGMGKSGHVGRKIASTLASTGTPAYFVHPAEASHGDLGMITRDDVLIAISNSGESAELLTIVPIVKRQGAKLISMTGNALSSLAILDVSRRAERVQQPKRRGARLQLQLHGAAIRNGFADFAIHWFPWRFLRFGKC